jgi:hypothetical protein
MKRKIIFGIIWLGLIIYAFGFAPPNQPDTFALIKSLSLGQWQGINPLIIALFNLMGILPLAYGCLLFIDGRNQPIPAWPFAIASFGFGAFALIPYLALRQENPGFSGDKDWFLKLQDSRLFAVILTISTIVLLGYGLVNGDWQDFSQQWQSDRFIHVMSLDFCLLSVLFPTLVKDDITRRKIQSEQLFCAISFIPLMGALLYLCCRDPLPETSILVSS